MHEDSTYRFNEQHTQKTTIMLGKTLALSC